VNSQSSVKHPMSRRFRGYLPVVVDVETAGFNAATDALLEVSATTLTMDENGMILPDHSISRHLIPFEGANIEQAALDFTRIDLQSAFRQSIAMSEHDALGEVFKMVRKAMKAHSCTRAILVGHNASFDLSFINAAVLRCGIKRNPFHPFSSFDTATLAALAYGQTVLARACKAAGIAFDNREAHSASYDTEKTAELFCAVVNTWHELGGWELALQTLPEPD
jgi:ribonuclease T